MNGRILLQDVTIQSQKCILINVYNANAETDQCNSIAVLRKLLSDHHDLNKAYPFFSGVMNVIFDSRLGALGG